MPGTALVVGVNYYQLGEQQCLYGCVEDARAVGEVLGCHGDGQRRPNFEVTLLQGTSIDPLERADLKRAIRDLFASRCETALFYFSGHGHVDETGGYLLASDARSPDDGISLNDVLVLANRSRALHRVIILDSCHSGIAGADPSDPTVAQLKEGTTILTASTAEQYSRERSGGLFTSLLINALEGAAANLVGEISPGSVYAHIDQSMGLGGGQRPMFKTNVQQFVSLRHVAPSIEFDELRRITEFFPKSGYNFKLNPTFEPERTGNEVGVPEPIKANTEIFAILQRYNRLNLLVPVGAPHMWHAAMKKKSCKLTRLGEHYRRLVQDGKL